jgi:hypothetical protein
VLDLAFASVTLDVLSNSTVGRKGENIRSISGNFTENRFHYTAEVRNIDRDQVPFLGSFGREA